MFKFSVEIALASLLEGQDYASQFFGDYFSSVRRLELPEGT